MKSEAPVFYFCCADRGENIVFSAQWNPLLLRRIVHEFAGDAQCFGGE
jgi:hypothetical protein